MTEPVNLFAPEVRSDPYPTYARLRRDAPVQQVEPMGLWAVSRYQDVEYVLKNPQVFSSSGFEALLKSQWLPNNPLGDSIAAKDGSGHAKLRALQSKAFSPSAIARIISVDACEPELPPVEMIIGMNRASSGSRSI